MPVKIETKQPYIFISYAHADKKMAEPLIRILYDGHYRFWYDRRISAGTDWTEDIANHIKECSVFVALITKNSAQSPNCKDEIVYARKLNKQMLVVFLEDHVDLPAGLDMQTGRFQRIYKEEKTFGELCAEVCTAKILEHCKGAPMIPPQPVTPLNTAPPGVQNVRNSTSSATVQTKKKEPFWIWSWLAPLLEFLYFIPGSYALREVVAFTDSGWGRFGLMLIPHALLAAFLRFMILKTGKNVSKGTKIGLMELLMLLCIFSSIVAAVNGIIWIDIEMNILLKISNAVLLNIAPGVLAFLLYSYFEI